MSMQHMQFLHNFLLPTSNFNGIPSNKLEASFDNGKDSDASSNCGRSHTQPREEELFLEEPMLGYRDDEQPETGVERKSWSEEQERLLLELHNQWGNKWTDISLKLQEKDHNSTKNHFYAQIRKSIRRLNTFISAYLHRQYKPLNMTHISKMITSLAERISPEPNTKFLVEKYEQQIFQMKEGFFQYAKKEEGYSLNESQVKKLCVFLDSVHFFLLQSKKTNVVGKKPKGRPSKAAKQMELHEKLSLAPASDEQGLTEIQISYFFWYCQQMAESSAKDVFAKPECIRSAPNGCSFTPYARELPQYS